MQVLVFNNADATPKTERIECSLDSVPLIMSWYNSHFCGDRYTVALNGRNVRMDINGNPTNLGELFAMQRVNPLPKSIIDALNTREIE